MSQHILLQEVYHKLQKLVKNHEHLKKENLRLKKDLEQKEKTAEFDKKELQSLKDQIAILQTSGIPLGEKGKKELETRINQYISDINKAIILLNE